MVHIDAISDRSYAKETLPKRLPALVVRLWIGGVWDRRPSVADEVVDPISAVARWVQYSTNHPVRIQNSFLDQTVQHLVDLRPQPNEYGIPQFFDFRHKVLQQVLPK